MGAQEKTIMEWNTKKYKVVKHFLRYNVPKNVTESVIGYLGAVICEKIPQSAIILKASKMWAG